MNENFNCKINIIDNEYYNSVLEFSKKINDESLIKCLERLRQITNNINEIKSKQQTNEPEISYYEIYLYKDFAPYSFYFVIRDKKEKFTEGGIIYHGNHDNGGDGGAPTFSVNLTSTKGWTMHT